MHRKACYPRCIVLFCSRHSPPVHTRHCCPRGTHNCVQHTCRTPDTQQAGEETAFNTAAGAALLPTATHVCKPCLAVSSRVQLPRSCASPTTHPTQTLSLSPRIGCTPASSGGRLPNTRLSGRLPVSYSSCILLELHTMRSALTVDSAKPPI